MRRWWMAAVLVLVVLAAGLAVALAWPLGPRPTNPPSVPARVPTSDVQEDDPSFDCRIDGNRICGPGARLPGGTPAVPGDYGTRGNDRAIRAEGSP